MKKVLIGIILLVLMAACFFIYNEHSFSPLKETEFQKLFNGYRGNINKSCNKDFLGISLKGELFEIYRYDTKEPKIDKDFPIVTEWENKQITDETIVGKWRNCPLDYKTATLYEFTLSSNNLNDVKCFNTFNKEILDPKNYFSFIHFSELEQYFLLYCTDSRELYYIRRKGF